MNVYNPRKDKAETSVVHRNVHGMTVSFLKKVQKEILTINTAQQGAQEEIIFSESTILIFETDTKIFSCYFIKVNLTTVASLREMRQKSSHK